MLGEMCLSTAENLDLIRCAVPEQDKHIVLQKFLGAHQSAEDLGLARVSETFWSAVSFMPSPFFVSGLGAEAAEPSAPGPGRRYPRRPAGRSGSRPEGPP